MNNKERLESHYRMYAWIQEQAKKQRWLSEDDRTDWVILEDNYPEMLMFIEELISHLEQIINKEQKNAR